MASLGLAEDAPCMTEKMELTCTLDCNQGAVRAVRFNLDGNYCLTCGSNKTIKLWNPETKVLLKTYLGHGQDVLDVRGSCDNSQLVSCGMDKLVVIWDVSSGAAVRKYRGHAGTVNTVRFNEDSSVAISGSIDGTVKIWDLKSKRYEPIQILEEPKDSVTSIDVSDHEILVGSADARVRRYDLRNGQLLTDTVGSSSVASVSFTRDGQCILVGLTSGEPVRLFDKSTGEMLQEFLGHKNASGYRIEAVLDHTDRRVLSGSEDGCVYIWDLVEASLVGKLEHNLGQVPIHSLCFHPDQSRLCTAAKDHIYLWSI